MTPTRHQSKARKKTSDEIYTSEPNYFLASLNIGDISTRKKDEKNETRCKRQKVQCGRHGSDIERESSNNRGMEGRGRVKTPAHTGRITLVSSTQEPAGFKEVSPPACRYCYHFV